MWCIGCLKPNRSGGVRSCVGTLVSSESGQRRIKFPTVANVCLPSGQSSALVCDHPCQCGVCAR